MIYVYFLTGNVSGAKLSLLPPLIDNSSKNHHHNVEHVEQDETFICARESTRDGEPHLHTVQSVFLLVPLHLQVHGQPMYITNPSRTTHRGFSLQDSTFNHMSSTQIISKTTTARQEISRQTKA